jgi:hypothetical protein
VLAEKICVDPFLKTTPSALISFECVVNTLKTISQIKSFGRVVFGHPYSFSVGMHFSNARERKKKSNQPGKEVKKEEEVKKKKECSTTVFARRPRPYY